MKKGKYKPHMCPWYKWYEKPKPGKWHKHDAVVPPARTYAYRRAYAAKLVLHLINSAHT